MLKIIAAARLCTIVTPILKIYYVHSQQGIDAVYTWIEREDIIFESIGIKVKTDFE
jgi:hypothetical protein